MLFYLFHSSIPLQVIDRLFTKILKNSKNYVCWVLVGMGYLFSNIIQTPLVSEPSRRMRDFFKISIYR